MPYLFGNQGYLTWFLTKLDSMTTIVAPRISSKLAISFSVRSVVQNTYLSGTVFKLISVKNWCASVFNLFMVCFLKKNVLGSFLESQGEHLALCKIQRVMITLSPDLQLTCKSGPFHLSVQNAKKIQGLFYRILA